jgi:hypothetical protein
MKRYQLAAVILLAALMASSRGFAQAPSAPEPHPGPAAIDQRLAGPTITALQGLLAMREAQLRTLHEDTDRTIAELRAKCGDACSERPGGEAKPLSAAPPAASSAASPATPPDHPPFPAAERKARFGAKGDGRMHPLTPSDTPAPDKPESHTQ